MSCSSTITTCTLPGVWNPAFYQGVDFDIILNININNAAWDFTGYSGKMALVDGGGNAVLTISTENDWIASMSNSGVITFAVPGSIIQSITAGTYQYDFIIIDSGGVSYPLLAGNALVTYSPTGSTT